MEIDLVTGEIVRELKEFTLYPATHYITTEEKMKQVLWTSKQSWKRG